MKKETEKPENARNERQKNFNFFLPPRRRSALAVEFRESYMAGQIDAFLEICIIVSPKNKNKEDWMSLTMSASDARKFASIAVREIMRLQQRSEARASVSQKILDGLRQKHLNF